LKRFCHYSILTWRFKSFCVSVDGDPSLVFPQRQLHPVPIAVVKLNARGPNLDRAGSEVQVDVEVTIQKLDCKVILNNKVSFL
jgi:hypothetical protein